MGAQRYHKKNGAFPVGGRRLGEEMLWRHSVSVLSLQLITSLLLHILCCTGNSYDSVLSHILVRRSCSRNRPAAEAPGVVVEDDVLAGRYPNERAQEFDRQRAVRPEQERQRGTN